MTAQIQKETRLQQLVAIHRAEAPPPEFCQPIPRKLRWTWFGKAVIVTTLGLVLCTFWVGVQCVRMTNEQIAGNRRVVTESRQYAKKLENSGKKSKAEEICAQTEEIERLGRKSHFLLLLRLAFVISGLLVHVGVTWFVHIRHELHLLRLGKLARATVMGHRRWLVIDSSIELAFTTDHGEHVRRVQPINNAARALFNAGDLVWVIYLPLHPKRARLLGIGTPVAVPVT